MLEKTFDPKTVEPRLYAAWETSGAFAPTDDLEDQLLRVLRGRYGRVSVERILSGLEAAVARPREIILAWSGMEPFLAPFGRRAEEVWSDPRLVPAMLGVLERSARSLPAVLDAAAGVRRGLVRFEPADDAGPARVALALA